MLFFSLSRRLFKTKVYSFLLSSSFFPLIKEKIPSYLKNSLIQLLTFTLAGWFRWILYRECWFQWLCGNQYCSSNFICCVCFLFLGDALQINGILVCWSSGGSILHWWGWGELFLFQVLFLLIRVRPFLKSWF